MQNFPNENDWVSQFLSYKVGSRPQITDNGQKFRSNELDLGDGKEVEETGNVFSLTKRYVNVDGCMITVTFGEILKSIHELTSEMQRNDVNNVVTFLLNPEIRPSLRNEFENTLISKFITALGSIYDDLDSTTRTYVVHMIYEPDVSCGYESRPFMDNELMSILQEIVFLMHGSRQIYWVLNDYLLNIREISPDFETIFRNIGSNFGPEFSVFYEKFKILPQTDKNFIIEMVGLQNSSIQVINPYEPTAPPFEEDDFYGNDEFIEEEIFMTRMRTQNFYFK